MLINATWPLFTRDSLAPQYHKWFYEQHMDKCQYIVVMLSANGADGGGMREGTKDSEVSSHFMTEPERQSCDNLSCLPHTQFSIFTIVRKVYRIKSTYTQISKKDNLQLERN